MLSSVLETTVYSKLIPSESWLTHAVTIKILDQNENLSLKIGISESVAAGSNQVVV